MQARRVVSAPGPRVAAGALTNADVTIVIAACNSSRPTQRWRHNSSETTGLGALWTEDAEGTRWCATSIAAGMWNLIECDGVNASTVCQGATGLTCRDNMTLCDASSSGHCAPIDGTKAGRQDISMMNWQGLTAGFDSSAFGSGAYNTVTQCHGRLPPLPRAPSIIAVASRTRAALSLHCQWRQPQIHV